VSSYPAVGRPASVSADEGDLPAGVMVAVPLRCLVSPLKGGAPVQDGDRSALVVAGTEKIRAGEPVVFLKVVAVAPAVVARKGQVRAAGSPCGHATLGTLEDWLDSQAGPGAYRRGYGTPVRPVRPSILSHNYKTGDNDRYRRGAR